VSAADLELANGTVRVKGTDRLVTLKALGAAAAAAGETILTNGAFKTAEFTYPNGTHICELEIDPRTGQVTVQAYTVVDDFGAVLNPMMLQGQVHGGIVQGIGQALLERTVFSPDGQLVTASFMDYCVPRADDVVSIAFETRNVPGRSHPFGMKGAGEAGTIGAAPAVINAVVDALWRHNGTLHVDMPATPEVLWRAVRGQ
jgi:aerobic carbon-monoxide dehydrogenase large subunit